MRRVAFPADRMASRPITPGHGADVERHLYAFAHVVAGAADLYEIPAGAEIAGAPVGVRLETARGQDDGLGVGLANLSLVLDLHAVDLRSEEHTSELQSLMRNSYAL